MASPPRGLFEALLPLNIPNLPVVFLSHHRSERQISRAGKVLSPKKNVEKGSLFFVFVPVKSCLDRNHENGQLSIGKFFL